MPLHSFFKTILRSDLSGEPVTPDADLRRRAPRVRISALHRVFFELESGQDRSILPMGNLSISGLALIRSARSDWPPPGSELRGTIHLAQFTSPAPLRLVHLTGDLVGCAFESPSPLLAQKITEHFTTELAALDMLAHDSSQLALQPDGNPHWFHGNNNSNLFYVERDNEIQRFFVTFFGNCLEGGTGQPTRFGVIIKEDVPSPAGSESIRWHQMLHAEQLSATLRFISNIPGLIPKHRDDILRLIC